MNRNFYIVFIALILSCFSSNNSLAQSTLKAKTDVQQISIGDQLRYFITATIDTTTTQLRWSNFADTFNTLELVERGKIDTQWKGSLVTYKQRLLITGFDSGSFSIPSFTFLTINKESKIDSLFTDSFRLLVNTILVDTTKPFKNIKGVAEVQISWLDNLPMIIALLIALGIVVWGIFYFIKKRKLASQILVPEKVENFHERTLRLIEELDVKELWQNDKPKEYYTELSEIIRHYIEVRFQTNAMELTTDELLRKAKKHREMATFSKSLRPLLEASDLAKFAKANPLPEEHIEALNLARNFVKVSKPKEQTIITNTNTSQPHKK